MGVALCGAVRPRYEEDLDDQLASAQNWQTLLLINLLVLGDADMFKTTLAYEVAGAALMGVNMVMLLTIFWEILPTRADVVRWARPSSLKNASKGAVAGYLGQLQEARESASSKAAIFRQGLAGRHSHEELGEATEASRQPDAVPGAVPEAEPEAGPAAEHKAAEEAPSAVIELTELPLLSQPSQRVVGSLAAEPSPKLEADFYGGMGMVTTDVEVELGGPPPSRTGWGGRRGRSRSKSRSLRPDEFDLGMWFSQSFLGGKDGKNEPTRRGRSKTPMGLRSRSRSAVQPLRRQEEHEEGYGHWFGGLFN